MKVVDFVGLIACGPPSKLRAHPRCFMDLTVIVDLHVPALFRKDECKSLQLLYNGVISQRWDGLPWTPHPVPLRHLPHVRVLTSLYVFRTPGGEDTLAQLVGEVSCSLAPGSARDFPEGLLTLAQLKWYQGRRLA